MLDQYTGYRSKPEPTPHHIIHAGAKVLDLYGISQAGQTNHTYPTVHLSNVLKHSKKGKNGADWLKCN